MREPAFWHRPASLYATLLTPIAALYGAATTRRMARRGADAGVPVICVGNYTLGGAGKTPTVLALAAMLTQTGERPVIISRGYGGQLRGPLSVDPSLHTARDVGDEPLMMAATVPVVVSRDRVAGAAWAREQDASVVLLDDGFQNSSLRKDLSLIVIDSRRALGNGRVFPVGPLRAPLAGQMARTDALIMIGDGDAATALAAQLSQLGKPVFRGNVAANDDTLEALRGTRVLAFAGIGDPDRFFRMLRANAIEVVSQRVFGDHHRFTPGEVRGLADEARRENLRLVTTQKDFARLQDVSDVHDIVDDIAVVSVTMNFSDLDRMRDLVLKAIAVKR